MMAAFAGKDLVAIVEAVGAVLAEVVAVAVAAAGVEAEVAGRIVGD